jgi:acetolactate synthase-1/2/3 large subunit
MLPHVKAFFTCNTTSEIVPALQEAFKIAREGVPGPVCIEYPLDVIYTEALVREFFEKPLANPKGLAATLMSKYVTFKMSQVFKGLRTARIGLPIPHHVPQHTEAQAKMVFNLLKGAKKPLLLVGAQSLSTCFGDGTTVAAAVAALGVPVYLASGARGLLGTSSPLQFRHNRRDALKEADVVVLFGVVTDFRLEYGQHVPRRVKLVSVNLSQEDLNRGLRLPDVKILADPGRFLADLGQMAMKKPVSPPPEWFDALNAREAKREAAIQKDADNETLPESGVKGAPGCNPVRLLKLVEKTMASDAIIVADGGDFVGTAAYTLRPRGPLKWLDPGPFGTLGVAGGFALAAAALNPGKEVWIIWGDGSSGYSIAEYDTFVRHGMKVISIIGNDACWTQICRDQKVFLEDDVGCMLAHTDYHTVAQGWGAAGIKISNDAETKEKLDEAVKTLNSGKPVVINAILRQSEFRKGSISM